MVDCNHNFFRVKELESDSGGKGATSRDKVGSCNNLDSQWQWVQGGGAAQLWESRGCGKFKQIFEKLIRGKLWTDLVDEEHVKVWEGKSDKVWGRSGYLGDEKVFARRSRQGVLMRIEGVPEERGSFWGLAGNSRKAEMSQEERQPLLPRPPVAKTRLILMMRVWIDLYSLRAVRGALRRKIG